MATFQLSDGATLGVKMKQGGQVYKPDKHNRIHVESRADAAAMRNSMANGLDMIAESLMSVAPSLPDNYCDGKNGCMMNNLIYRTTCVRCNNALPLHDKITAKE